MTKSKGNRNLLAKIIVMIIIAELAGFIGSLVTLPSIEIWYSALVKPSFNPPSWLFGSVWTVLYTLMGIAAGIVWNSKSKMKTYALKIYGLQLVLNVSWSLVFFGLHLIQIAFIEIVILWLTIIWTMNVFRKISKNAFYFLIPYIIWVSFAAFLNLSILLLNT